MKTRTRRNASIGKFVFGLIAAVGVGLAAAPTAHGANMDVGVTKTIDNSTPLVGDTIVYTIRLTNNSPNSADTLVITDRFPSAVTYASHGTTLGTYNPTTRVWTAGSLVSHTSQVLVITGIVNFAATPTVTNIAAFVSSADTDTNANNNVSTALFTVVTNDLGIGKSADTNLVLIGSNVTFTLSVTNFGPLGATLVQATDLLPASLNYVTNGAGVYNPVSGVWTIGSLANGSVTSLTITAALNGNGAGLVITNQATISNAQQADAAAANNSAIASFQAGPSTNGATTNDVLILSKTASDTTPTEGQTFNFIVTARNNGPHTVTNYTVLDILDPAVFSFNSATPSQGTYDPTNGVWTIGTLATALSRTLTLSVTMQTNTAARTFTNVASVLAFTGFDPNTTNNANSVTVTVVGADIGVTKTVNSNTATIGNTIIYTVSVTNKGPSNATGISLTDILPAGLAYVSSSLTQGTYTPTNGVWVVGNVNALQGETLTITCTVTSAPGLVISNTAFVSAAVQLDSVTNNNSATASFTITGVSFTDFGVSKVAATNIYEVSGVVIYNIAITNFGTNAATNVKVQDLLPSTLTYVTNSAGTNYDAGTGIWTLSSLAAGADSNLVIAAILNNSGAGLLITNTASFVSAGNVSDNNPGNNSASATFQAGRGTDPDLAVPPVDLQVIPAGSFIIPMDTNFQNVGTFFNMKAYGLVNAMLVTNVPVIWAIRSGKAHDDVDFTASTVRIFPGGTNALQLVPTNRAFRTGPFIISSLFTNKATRAITNFANNVAVYRLVSNITVDVRYTLTTKPQVIINDNGGNESIHIDNMIDAGIPTNQYLVMNATNVATLAATSCFTIVTAPHYASATATAETAAIRAFLNSGGNFLVQCHSIETYENVTNGHFITTGGVSIPNDSVGFTYNNGDASFGQIQSELDDTGGSEQEFTPLPGSSYTNSFLDVVRSANSSTGSVRAGMSKLRPNQLGTLVFFLGGHDFANSPIEPLNGERLYMNAVFMPSGRPEGCGFSFGTDLIIDKNDGVITADKGQILTYTILVTNKGPVSVVGASVVDIFPTEITNAVWSNAVFGGASVPAVTGTGTINQLVNMPVGSKIIYTVKAGVGFAPSCTVSNEATVTVPLDVIETNPNNNRDDDVDFTPSALSCPPSLNLACTDDVPPAATTIEEFNAQGGTATNCCGSPVTFYFVGESSNGGSGCAGDPLILTRTYHMEDFCGLGNTNECEQTITVADTNAPVLIGVPVNATNQCDNVSGPPVVTSTDNCTTNVTVNFNETTNLGTCTESYLLVRVWSASDDCGNSVAATQRLTVVDTTAPQLSGVPANATNQCDNVSPPAEVSATDNCDTTVPVNFSETTNAGGQCAQSYSLIRVWSASDNCGNGVAATQVVSVVDTTAPVLSGQGTNTTIECPATPVFTPPTATDNCDTNPIIAAVTTTNFGPCGGAYVMTRVWVAYDACSNLADAVTQQITVVDTTAPTLFSVPNDATNQCDNVAPPATVTATDACVGVVSVHFAETTNVSAECKQSYTLTRIWSAVDSCTNYVAATQMVTVVDTTKPVLTGQGTNTTIECPLAPSFTPPIATDNCDTNPIIAAVTTTNFGPCGGAYVMTRVWVAYDACSNLADAVTQIVTVVDTTSPTLFGVPANTTNQCDNVAPPATVTATDACVGVVSVDFLETTNVSPACPQSYTLTRIWSTVDNCTNYVAATQLVTVVDTTKPVLSGQGTNTTIECPVTPVFTPPTALDNCDTNPIIAAVTTTNFGPCGGAYVMTRVWVAYDACSNLADAVTQIVTVVDTTAPTLFSVPANTTNQCDNVAPPATVTATDACVGVVSVDFLETTNVSPSCSQSYLLTRIWSAVDSCTNYVAATQLVQVVDTTKPVLSGQGTNTTIECPATPSFTPPIATDNCDTNPIIAAVTTTNFGPCGGAYVMTRVWVAYDACSNLADAVTQIVTVVDTTTPTLYGVPSNTTNQCDNVLAPPLVTATDACVGTVSVNLAVTTNVSPTCPQSYTLTRIWSTVDNCTNYIAATQLVTVVDTTKPVLSGQGTNTTIECPATPVFTKPIATDNCDTNPIIAAVTTTNFGPCGGAYVMTRVWVAYDACSNLADAVTQIVTVVDTTMPTLYGVPTNTTNQCDNVLAPPLVTATDACVGALSVDLSVSTNTSVDCPQKYTLTRIWSAQDSCSNYVAATQVVYVIDTTAPIITCATNSVTLTGDANCQAQLPELSASATDNCDTNVTYIQNPPAGTIITGDSNTFVTITALDDCGNSNNCSVTVHVQCTGSIEIQKTVYLGHDGGASCPGSELVSGTNGAQITYCLSVTNTGTVNLTNVVVTDTTISPSFVTNLGLLGVGQALTVYADRFVSVDLTNVATVTSTDPIGGTHGDTNTAQVDLISPNIDVQKTASGGAGAFPGGELVLGTNTAPVRYWFVVLNNGDVTLTNVTLNDVTVTPAYTTNLGTLVAGQSVTVSVNRTIISDLTNLVTASGQDLNGDAHVDTDTARVDLIAPTIAVAKTASGGAGAFPGGELVLGTNTAPVRYWFVVTNPGDTTLTNVTLNDLTVTPTYATNLGTLVAGQSVTVFVDRLISGDLTNLVVARGQDPNSATYTNSDTARVDLIAPTIAVAKTASGKAGTFPGSEFVQGTNTAPVRYWFVVTNPGDTTLTNVTLNDVTVSPPYTTNIGTLVAGQSVTVSLDRLITVDLTNLVAATGQDPNSAVYTNSNTAAVDLIAPAIHIEKTVSRTGAFPGGEIALGTNGAPVKYWFVVSNIGDVTLTNVTVNDVTLGYNTNVGTLVVGQAVTVSVSSVISTSLVNTATATGKDPNGDPYSDTDTAEVVLINPGLNILKTVSLSGTCPGVSFVQGTNGQAVTYCFTVGNLGDVTLTNVYVNDPKLAYSNNIGTLVVGQIVTVSLDTVISKDLTNTATASGLDPNGTEFNDTDSAQVDLVAPGIVVEKTVSLSGTCAGLELVQGTNGAPVTYCFIVSNTGDVPLASVTLVDNTLTPTYTNVIGTLNAGQSVTASVTRFITADLTNVVTVTSVGPNNVPYSDQDDARVDLIAPSILVAKTASGGAGAFPGGELVLGTNNAPVRYWFVVTNPGDTTLTNVTLNDITVTPPYTTNLGTLVAGQSKTVSVNRLITADLTNLVAAVGQDPNGAAYTNKDTAAVDRIAPTIAVAKTASGGAGAFPGGELVQGTNTAPVRYWFVVTNPGDTTLTNVTLNDLTVTPTYTTNLGTLVAGQSVTVSVSRTITADLTNLVVATGQDPNSAAYTNSNTAAVDLIAPNILVAKTASGHLTGFAYPGVELVQGTNTAPVTYWFKVTNPGDTTLTNVTLNDVTVTPPYTTNLGTLVAGQSKTVSVNRLITGDLTNLVAAVGQDPNGAAYTNKDTAAVDLIAPTIDVQKTASGHLTSFAYPGVELVQGTNTAPVTYWFKVTNPGDVTLTNVTLVDNTITPPYTNVIGNLAAGQSVTVSVNRLITGDLTNLVTATGRDANSDSYSDTDTAQVDLIAPTIDVQKTASGHLTSFAYPGVELVQGTNTAPVTYWFKVTNPGDVTLTNVTLVDNTITPPYTNVIGNLAAGQSVTVSVNRLITGDLTNLVTATGRDANSDSYSDTDTAQVDLIAPTIDVQKTASGHLTGFAYPGVELVQGTNTAPVTYWFKVTNPGDVTLTNVTLNDATVTPAYTTNLGTLAAGQSKTVSVNRLITTDLTNLVTATGRDANSDSYSDTDTAQVDLIAPTIDVQKTASGGAGTFPGGELVLGTNTAPVRYWFVVTNPGDVTLTNVTLNDVTVTPPYTTNLGSLAAGQSVTVSVARTITSDLTNLVTATGRDANSDSYSDTDTARVDLIAPTILVAKTASGGAGAFPGGELVLGTNNAPVRYWFVVTNPGDVTLTNVTLNDATVTPPYTTNLGTFIAGQSKTVSVDRLITVDLTNLVAATGQDPNGAAYTNKDTAAVDRIAPSILVAKTASGGAGAFPGGELVLGTNTAPVRYWFVVTNPGDVTLTNVTLNDATVTPPYTTNLGTFIAGQSKTVSVDRLITVDLTNLVAATGQDPNGAAYTNKDTAAVDRIAPAIGLSKTVSLDGNCPGVEVVSGMDGTPLNYCFIVRNLGDVTLTNVTLVDPLLSISTNIGNLAAGQSVTVSVGTVVSVTMTNTATASGKDPNGFNYSTNDTAAVIELMRITGSVLYDVNANGNFDVPDTNGIAGVTVSLLNAASNVIATTTTAANGGYQFTNIAVGTYTVVETDLPSYVSTGDIVPPNDNRIPVTIVSGVNSTGNNFLDTLIAAVGDFVWYDLNQNGVQNPGEPGLPDARMSLLTTNGSALLVITSSVNGAYFFTNVPPGTYTIRIGPPPGFGLTTNDVGVNDNIDSDFLQLTLITPSFTLVPNEVRTNVDAGLWAPPNFAHVVTVEGSVENGAAVLTWSTESEDGTAGWYVERQTAEGEWNRVSEFLPAIGGPLASGSYAWRDSAAKVGGAYTYRLVEVENRGTSRLLGPYEVTYKATRVSSTAPKLGGSSYSSVAKSKLVNLSSVQPLSLPGNGTVSGAKVRVKQAGLCRVTAAELAGALGLSTSAVTGKTWHVENLGQDVSSLRDNGDVVFFGHAYESMYTDANVYWIMEGAGSPLIQEAVGPAGGAGAASYAETLKVEQQAVLRSDLFSDGNSDMWLWGQILSGIKNSFTTGTGLPNLLAGSGGELVVKFKGASDAPGQNEHGARVELNGQVLGHTTFSGLNIVTVSLAVAGGQWVEGTNSIKVVTEPPPGMTFDTYYVDNISANYAKRYVAGSNGLVFKASAGSVKVGGLSGPNVELWEVTGGWQAVRLTGYGLENTGGVWTVSFYAPRDGTYTVCVKGSERGTAGVAAGYGNDLKETGLQVDYLAVAGAGLESGAQALADYRASKGLLAKVVGIESVYDAFNYGIPDGRAIKAMLGYAYRQWSKSPRYVALVGDGSLDFRNYLGYGENLVPTPPQGGYYGTYMSDHSVGDVTGDGILEMAVGRIPAKTPAEVTNYLSKLTSFEAGGSWRSKVMISTDERDAGGDYIDNGNKMATLIANKTIERADVEVDGVSTASAELKSSMGAGRDLVMYIGHGNLTQMAKAGLVTATDAAAFSNAASPGVVSALGCLMGSFGVPGTTSLGEQLVTDNGGAVAMLGAGTLVVNYESCMLGENLLSSIYSNGVPRLGDSWITAKALLEAASAGAAAKAYQLMGDPALASGSSTAPRGGPAVGPARGSYDEWKNWAFGPSWMDQGLLTDQQSDSDGDGMNNGAEYFAGTSPTDDKSQLVMVTIKSISGGKVEVRWPAAPARLYRVERAPSLTGTFGTIADDFSTTAAQGIWTDAAPGAVSAVYRVRVK